MPPNPALPTHSFDCGCSETQSSDSPVLLTWSRAGLGSCSSTGARRPRPHLVWSVKEMPFSLKSSLAVTCNLLRMEMTCGGQFLPGLGRAQTERDLRFQLSGKALDRLPFYFFL